MCILIVFNKWGVGVGVGERFVVSFFLCFFWSFLTKIGCGVIVMNELRYSYLERKDVEQVRFG